MCAEPERDLVRGEVLAAGNVPGQVQPLKVEFRMGEATARDQPQHVRHVKRALSEHGNGLIGDVIARAGLIDDRDRQSRERRQVDRERGGVLDRLLVRVEPPDRVLEFLTGRGGQADFLREQIGVVVRGSAGDLELERVCPEDVRALAAPLVPAIGGDRRHGERTGVIVHLKRDAEIVVGAVEALGGAVVLVAGLGDHAARGKLVCDPGIGDGERCRQRQDARAARLDDREEVALAGRPCMGIVADQVERERFVGPPQVAAADGEAVIIV